MHFVKYHALGNDCLVLDARTVGADLAPALIRRLCDRHRGVGSDGILLRRSEHDGHRVRIFNPDGSEAEKSGNGLRILARALWDLGLVTAAPFDVETLGGRVTCRVLEAGRRVTVDMGRVTFDSAAIPVRGARREVLDEEITVGGRTLRYSAASIGNPHCVLVRARVTSEETRALGPLLEREPRFPNRTNVQFVQVLAPDRLAVEIWERGAGYTLASGSSACAAAAVAHRLGRCAADVTVGMPGGELSIGVGTAWDVRMTGPVVRVAEGTVAAEALEDDPAEGGTA
jgi:diaminopimelate epimerase